jgi:alpha-L-rhamnosidase
MSDSQLPDSSIYNSPWAWPEVWSSTDKEQPRLVYFRKSFTLPASTCRCTVEISADSRYKLLINGHLASVGPCKGDDAKWYYETVDLSPWLVPGENVISVIVLRLKLEWSTGNHSVWRTSTPGLYVVGDVRNEQEEIVFNLSTTRGWKCLKDQAVTFVAEDYIQYLYAQEIVEGIKKPWGFDFPGFDDSSWEPGWNYKIFQIHQKGSPFNLSPRPIPPLYETPRRFTEVFTLPESQLDRETWNQWLQDSKPIILPAGSREIIEISAGELTTGYLQLAVQQGAGSTIKILSSESYAYPTTNPYRQFDELRKGDRLDYQKGVLTGSYDEYQVAGIGTIQQPEQYEPYWFRTFRFVRLEIAVGEQPLHLLDFSYRETGYPLDVQTKVTTSDPELGRIWEISLRTLRRCMHETYEDCPFYEQLQYAMDTRSQILFTYAVSADDRMARRCIDDYHRSLRADGLINCCYPEYNYNVIPGFALYYIMMIHDHMRYFGDQALVRRYLGTIDSILGFFDRKVRPDGLIDKTGGGLSEGGLWSFVDWAKGWPGGVPPAGDFGPLTVENLLYAYTLNMAADLAEYAGRPGVASEYRSRSNAVITAVNATCSAANGYYQDGPGYDAGYSQHAQVWAVLSGAVQGPAATELMQRTLNDDSLNQCTVAMAFYLFRAVEQTGLYNQTKPLWNPWREMLANNLTTCSETEGEVTRSDCHAWGSVALYELPSVVLGVSPLGTGYDRVEIRPRAGHLTQASGTVITPKGLVQVAWRIDNQEFHLAVTVPVGLSARIVLPDQTRQDCRDGNYEFSSPI